MRKKSYSYQMKIQPRTQGILPSKSAKMPLASAGQFLNVFACQLFIPCTFNSTRSYLQFQ